MIPAVSQTLAQILAHQTSLGTVQHAPGAIIRSRWGAVWLPVL
jgi:hypothetical protein